MGSTRLSPTHVGWIRLDLCDGLGWIEFFLPTIMGWVKKIPSTQRMHTTRNKHNNFYLPLITKEKMRPNVIYKAYKVVWVPLKFQSEPQKCRLVPKPL